MRNSSTPLSCARFIMLSLSGARQISGNRVTMSIFMKRQTSNVQPAFARLRHVRRRTSNESSCRCPQGQNSQMHSDICRQRRRQIHLFDDLERVDALLTNHGNHGSGSDVTWTGGIARIGFDGHDLSIVAGNYGT